MNFTTDNPSELLADKDWRRKNSRWRWWVFLGFGGLGFIGFFIVAFRVQTKKFWTAAFVAGVGSAAAWVVSGLNEQAGGTTTTTAASSGAASSLVSGVLIAIWGAQVVYALFLNRDYLRWKADSRNEWYNQSVVGQAAINSASAPPPPPVVPQTSPFLGVDTSEYVANVPATQSAPAPILSPVSAPATQHAITAPIDINSASAGDIAMAVGVDDAVVRRVLDARIQRGGFSNLDDMVARAGLQPHEMLRFRDKVSFGSLPAESSSTHPTPGPLHAKPRNEPGAGRVLDY